jgi:hypothetical protein
MISSLLANDVENQAACGETNNDDEDHQDPTGLQSDLVQNIPNLIIAASQDPYSLTGSR